MTSRIEASPAQEETKDFMVSDGAIRFGQRKKTAAEIKRAVLQNIQQNEVDPDVLTERSVISLPTPLPPRVAAVLDEEWSLKLQKIWRDAFIAAVTSFRETLLKGCFKENATRDDEGTFHIPIHCNPKTQQYKTIQRGLQDAFHAYAEKALEAIMLETFIESSASDLLVHPSFDTAYKRFILLKELPSPVGMTGIDTIDYFGGKKSIFVFIKHRPPHEMQRIQEKLGYINEHVSIGSSGNNESCAYFILEKPEEWQSLIGLWESWERQHPIDPKSFRDPDQEVTIV